MSTESDHAASTLSDGTDCGIVVVHTTFSEIDKLPPPAHRDSASTEKEYHCEVCDKTFTQLSNLKRHERTHTGERPYSCPTCGRCFAQGNNLKAHMRLHTGERPYECTLCNRSFAQSSNMYKHMRNHSDVVFDGKPTRRFGCAVCNKCFVESSMLMTHLRTHTGERPFACDLCDRSFTQDSNLRRHRRIHTGEKPYLCSICSRGFTQSNNLKVHMSSIHGMVAAAVSTTMFNVECGDKANEDVQFDSAEDLKPLKSEVLSPRPIIVIISKSGQTIVKGEASCGES